MKQHSKLFKKIETKKKYFPGATAIKRNKNIQNFFNKAN